MKLLFGQDQAVAEFVARHAGKPFHAPYTALGLVDSAGTLHGGFVFTGYNGDCIELSLAGRAAATRGAFAAMFHYVFAQLGCARLQMHTRRSNKAALRLIARFGMRYEGIARRFYGSEDGVCYAIIKDDLSGFRQRWRLAWPTP